LAAASDLLIHDSQYTTHEYLAHVGWGHSSLKHVLAFKTLAEVRHLVPFHHDPDHSDADLGSPDGRSDLLRCKPAYRVSPGREGHVV
jgi:ribonuclease BN (tRNA processing enzyme)